MAGPKKTLESVKQGGRNIAFRDLRGLLEKLGFRLNRVSGSHHIYVHPRVPRPMMFKRSERTLSRTKYVN
jgi:predicted RNA binding protein YcfA (HicA-like mRNA interferase family)